MTQQDSTARSLRIIEQQLESLRRSGVASLIRPAPAERAPLVAAASPAALPSAPPAPVEGPTALDLTSIVSAPVQDAAPRGATLSLAERKTRLGVLAQAVSHCTRCDELATTRTQTVFGVGNPLAKIVFVGEAPGADEDRQGEPFVGRAGALLNQIIAACRLKREEIYICNILKCRPPGNRTPLPDECGNCAEFLHGQLSAIDPEYIVCWGAVAAQNLLKTTVSIGKLRHSFFVYGRAKVVCTYHPSYLLRNPAAKSDVWADMKFLFADMGIDLSSGSMAGKPPAP